MERGNLGRARAAAITAHQGGRLEEAEADYRRILRSHPHDCHTLSLYGALCAQTGRLDQARALLGNSLALDDDQPLAHNNLGIVLSTLEQRREALASFDRAIQLQSDYADAYFNRAVVLHALGNLQSATLDLNRTIGLARGHVSALRLRARILQDTARCEAALVDWRRILELTPEDADALYNEAVCLQGMGELEAALGSLDRALALMPGHAAAHSQRGALLCEMERPSEALESCDRAIAAAPGLTGAHVNRGIALLALGRIEESLLSFDAAVSRDSHDWTAYYNRAGALLQAGRFGPALADYDRCIALRPEDAEAHNAKGLALLLMGDFPEGFRSCEWRQRRGKSFRARVVELPQPRWRGGASLDGSTLFVHWEQGLGDTIQFCRYALVAAGRGAHVILEVQSVLQRLLACLAPHVELVTDLSESSRADLWCPMLSLPAACGVEADDVQWNHPYLAAEPQKIAYWRERIGPSGLRIGICWQGSQGRQDAGRSFPLAMFAGIAALPGARLISLQKGPGSEQLQGRPRGMRVETLGESFDAGPDAFVDTAAVMQSLDLVITSDTAIAHLAGALGRPTWVLLKKLPDWRWMLDRRDCPWYPSVRLFRQHEAGDWDGVFARVQEELGFFDHETDRVTMAEKPFGARVLPGCPE